MKNSSQASDANPFHVTYVAYRKKLVDFQINLFVKTDSFPLRTVDCRYSSARTDVDFDHETDNFLEVTTTTKVPATVRAMNKLIVLPLLFVIPK